MVKLQVIACDKCGIKEGKRPISTWAARRGTTRWSGDLCDKCWDELLNTFNPTSLAKGRHAITVTEIKDIPKNP